MTSISRPNGRHDGPSRGRVAVALAGSCLLAATACTGAAGATTGPGASPPPTSSAAASSPSGSPPSASPPSVSPPSPASTGAASSTARPNIVFVLTDDLSMNLVPYMPHVRALQQAGTTFSNYSVTDSLCCPSRSSILTGDYPHTTGVFTNTGKDGGFDVFHGRGDDASTFATALQQAGYRTAMMGKYLNGYTPRKDVDGTSPFVPPGWDEWDVAGNGYPEFDYNLTHGTQVQHYGKAPTDYLTDVLSRRASDFVSSSASAHTPFLLEVATFAPHGPYTPAPRDATSFPGLKAPRTAAYDTLPTGAPSWLAGRAPLTPAEQTQIDTAFRKRVQAVQSVDRMIGELQATLARAGVAGNTDVVFSSDNGYHMGEYRLTPGKQTAFDTDVHVPLVAAGPGIARGATVAQPVANVDLAPTFETLGGAPVPAECEGHTLTDLMSGQRSGWRTASLVEHHGPDTDPSDPDHPAKNSGNPTTYEALRAPTYTYVEYANGQREFYDRRTDPAELHNTVAKLPAATAARLHTALAAQHACTDGKSCWAAGSLAPAVV